VALLASLVLSCGDEGATLDRNDAPTGSPDDDVAARTTARMTTDVDSAVRAVARGFSDALAAGDSVAVLALLDPNVLIFEAGHAENLQQYREGHLAADMAVTASVQRNIVNEYVVTTRDMAMYTSQYTAVGRFRGHSVDTRGAETIVLIPTEAGWKIRHIHWSSPGSSRTSAGRREHTFMVASRSINAGIVIAI